MALKLIKTLAKDSSSVKVYRDSVVGEYLCKFFKLGKHLHKADYATDDLHDALNTARWQVGLPVLQEA